MHAESLSPHCSSLGPSDPAGQMWAFRVRPGKGQRPPGATQRCQDGPIGQRPPPRGHTAQTGWAHWPAPPRVTQLRQDGPVCPPPSVTQLTQDGPVRPPPRGHTAHSGRVHPTPALAPLL